MSYVAVHDAPDDLLQESVSGKVVVMTKSETKIESLHIEMEGTVRIQASGKSLGVIDALANQSVKVQSSVRTLGASSHNRRCVLLGSCIMRALLDTH